jgi:hypothetical protein
MDFTSPGDDCGSTFQCILNKISVQVKVNNKVLKVMDFTSPGDARSMPTPRWSAPGGEPNTLATPPKQQPAFSTLSPQSLHAALLEGKPP